MPLDCELVLRGVICWNLFVLIALAILRHGLAARLEPYPLLAF